MSNFILFFVGKVVVVGKKEYFILMYINMWFNFDDFLEFDLRGVLIVVGGGVDFGVYFLGGLCLYLLDVWCYNILFFDFLVLDFYFYNYEIVCCNYME